MEFFPEIDGIFSKKNTAHSLFRLLCSTFLLSDELKGSILSFPEKSYGKPNAFSLLSKNVVDAVGALT